LNPTKSKSLIPIIAKKLNLPEDMVAETIDFYYDELAKKIENFEGPKITIKKLGEINFSRPKIVRKIGLMEKQLASEDPEEFVKIVRYNINKEYVDSCKQAVKKFNKYYEELKEKRNQNLERKRGNSGGNQE